MSRGCGETAQRLGRGTALQRDPECAHAHTQGRRDRVDSDRQEFGVDAFREVIAGRLHKLEPLGYQLVDVPLKFHHPMWREHCQVDLNYHIRPWRLRAPGVGANSTRRSEKSPAPR